MGVTVCAAVFVFRMIKNEMRNTFINECENSPENVFHLFFSGSLISVKCVVAHFVVDL